MLAGAKDFLTRPLSTRELQNVVTSAVELRGKRKRMEHQLANGPRYLGTIISVYSAKGGVGKTTLATNLAVSLARVTKQQVALVDLDLQMGDVAMMMGLAPGKGVADAAQQIDRLDLELMQSFLSHHSSSVDVLAAPRHPEQAEKVSAPQVRRIIELLASKYDFIVVDMPAELNDVVLMALDLSTFVLLVATKELPCLRRVEQTLRLMQSWGYSEDKLKLVVNRSDSKTGVDFADIQKGLSYSIFWAIPSDFSTVVNSTLGCPFTQTKPKSKIAMTIDKLAHELSGVEMPQPGLWRRWLSRLRRKPNSRRQAHVQVEPAPG
jgi:pilus assembly protein CpaE